jgi:hypothetical protein
VRTKGMADEVARRARECKPIRPKGQYLPLEHWADVGGALGQRLAWLVEPAPPYYALLRGRERRTAREDSAIETVLGASRDGSDRLAGQNSAVHVPMPGSTINGKQEQCVSHGRGHDREHRNRYRRDS